MAQVRVLGVAQVITPIEVARWKALLSKRSSNQDSDAAQGTARLRRGCMPGDDLNAVTRGSAGSSSRPDDPGRVTSVITRGPASPSHSGLAAPGPSSPLPVGRTARDEGPAIGTRGVMTRGSDIGCSERRSPRTSKIVCPRIIMSGLGDRTSGLKQRLRSYQHQDEWRPGHPSWPPDGRGVCVRFDLRVARLP